MDRRQDAEMDRLLKTALDASADAGTPGDCPAADDVAAYVERSLPRAEAARLDAHFAACGRCQQVLGTFASMTGSREANEANAAWQREEEQGATGAIRWWWPVGSTRWLVPASAVAAALILYVALNPPLVLQRRSLAPAEPPALVARQLPSAPAPTMLPEAGPETRTAMGGPAKEAGAAASAAPSPARTAFPRHAREGAPPAAVGQMAADTTRDRGEPTASKGESRIASAKPAPSAPPALPSQAAPGTPAPAENAPLPAQGVPVVADAATKTGTRTAKLTLQPPPAAPPPPAAAPMMMEALTVTTQARGAAGGQPTGIVLVQAADDAAVRWRFEPKGQVSRSTDGGVSWHRQAVPGPLEVRAGIAPSSLICWAVGAAGAVLRTTDGSQWEVLPFPERIDLVWITAPDALRATVAARDGRRLATGDGGKTWSPVR